MSNDETKQAFEEALQRNKMKEEKRKKKLETIQKKTEENQLAFEKTKEEHLQAKNKHSLFQSNLKELNKQMGLENIDISKEIKQKEAASEKQFDAIQKERLRLIESLGFPEDLKKVMKERYGLHRDAQKSKPSKKQIDTAPIRSAGRSSRRGWLPMR